jgi:hypothetical protein
MLVCDTTETELTVMPDPKSTPVPPLKKPVPVSETTSVCPLAPITGLIPVSVGAGFSTLKILVRVALPPPGGATVTVTLRAAARASSAIVRFAVALVDELTVNELTVTPAPKLTLVIPATKFVPVNVTSSVWPLIPLKRLRVVRVGAGLATVNAPDNVAEPPPGAAFDTVTSLTPTVAEELIEIPAVIFVPATSTVTELTAMPEPRFTVVRPSKKSEPAIATVYDWPTMPVVGEIDAGTGGGFWIVRAAGNVADPPPGAGFVTVTSLTPATASRATARLAESCVGLTIETEPIVTPDPAARDVTLTMKLLPVTVTLAILPLAMTAGAMPWSVGAGFITVNPPASFEDPPPGVGFDTVMSRKPAAASFAMVTLAVSCVGLVVATEFTVTPAPRLTEVRPERKLPPVTVSVNVCPRGPLFGETLLTVGAGLRTEKALGRVAVPPPGGGTVTVTVREPGDAPIPILISATILLILDTETEETPIPSPNDTLVSALAKPLPWRVTTSVWPRVPDAGEMLDREGAGFWGTVTWNAPASVAVLDPPFETVTSRGIPLAKSEIVMFTVIWVGEFTVTEFTVMPDPLKLTVDAPAKKFVPVKITFSVDPW